MIQQYKDGKLILKTLIIAIFVCGIVGYGLFQSEKIITGPQITLTSPIGTNIATDSVSVTGVAKNISAISLDDRPIFVDETGHFDEQLLLYPGYNIIKLKAEDKFGKTVEKDIELVYNQ